MPQNGWILDVLSDLKAFASSNGLSGLAEQLEDTKLLAAAEIASLEQGVCHTDAGGRGGIESHSGGARRYRRA